MLQAGFLNHRWHPFNIITSASARHGGQDANTKYNIMMNIEVLKHQSWRHT